MKKQIAIVLALLVSLALSGCGAMRAATPAAISPEVYPAVPADSGLVRQSLGITGVEEAPLEGYEAAPGAAPSAVDRLVIQTANLSIVVPDPATSVEEISQMAQEMGGFVVSSNVYQSTFGTAQVVANQASITIRVPAERLDEALRRIKAGATEVQNENVSGQDVTAQYTDLESSLRNLEAAEEQLREIMASATKTEDVMMVFNQLTQVRGQIEMVRGQMRYYEESARLSAVSVELIPDVAEQPIQIGGWHPEGTAKEAIEDLIRALQFLADAVIRLGICGLPFLVIFGLPAWYILRLIIRRRQAAKVATDKE